MESKSKNLLYIFNLLSWLIFIGICIKTGAILISFIVSLFVNPDGASDLYLGLNLSELYNYSIGHYVSIVSILILLWGLKAYIFYIIIKIFSKINYAHPFSTGVNRLISTISYVALGVGIIAMITNNYSDWVSTKGVALDNLGDYLSGGPEFLFMSIIIFFIAQVFKRGIEIQSENSLTI